MLINVKIFNLTRTNLTNSGKVFKSNHAKSKMQSYTYTFLKRHTNKPPDVNS